MIQEFTGAPIQIKLINALAIQSYQELAQQLGISRRAIHKQPLCVGLSDLLIEKLGGEGYPATKRFYPLEHEHVYLGNQWIADSAWKYYLDTNSRRNPHLPRVLVAQLDTLPTILTRFGVPVEKFKLWTEALTI